MFSTRRRPLHEAWPEMDRLHQEMNRLFGRYGDGVQRTFAAAFPALNVWEDEDKLYVEAELPGMELEDLEIYVDGGNQLRLKGERKRPEHEKTAWHRRERGFGEFYRSLDLPTEVDADLVEARLHNGVLSIELPKGARPLKPRRIEVRAN